CLRPVNRSIFSSAKNLSAATTPSNRLGFPRSKRRRIAPQPELLPAPLSGRRPAALSARRLVLRDRAQPWAPVPACSEAVRLVGTMVMELHGRSSEVTTSPTSSACTPRGIKFLASLLLTCHHLSINHSPPLGSKPNVNEDPDSLVEDRKYHDKPFLAGEV